TEELAAVISGPSVDATDAARLWALVSDALRLLGVTVHADAIAGLHPTRGARLVGADGAVIGAVGEVDPDVVGAFGLRGRVAYLGVEVERLAVQPCRLTTARPISRFPASDIDLAFVVADWVPADHVEATVASGAGPLLERVGLFDIYRGPQAGVGRRSLAYRLRFRASDRTLTDVEVARFRSEVIAAVAAAHDGALRG
ncbi:MAG: phenylalanine--tRNA ligase subunit beta, partial [Actinomycetota bacterium]|nr:phenylalanine--tRNA ligase subunit beta [Actinomycetota bacterium]